MNTANYIIMLSRACLAPNPEKIQDFRKSSISFIYRRYGRKVDICYQPIDKSVKSKGPNHTSSVDNSTLVGAKFLLHGVSLRQARERHG